MTPFLISYEFFLFQSNIPKSKDSIDICLGKPGKQRDYQAEGHHQSRLCQQTHKSPLGTGKVFWGLWSPCPPQQT